MVARVHLDMVGCTCSGFAISVLLRDLISVVDLVEAVLAEKSTCIGRRCQYPQAAEDGKRLGDYEQDPV